MMEKMAPGEIEEDETNEHYDSDENSDEDSSSEEQEPYTDRGPKKFCFCIPWEPLHYIHTAVAATLTVLGIINGFYWFIRGC